jgi:hypothetical protein
MVLVGCSGLTKVDAPDLVQPFDLDTPSAATARYAGAVAQFAGAFQDQVTQSGVISDEFQDVGGGNFPADRRAIAPDNSAYPFAALSLARIDALRAITSLQRNSPEPPARIGELFALVGFIEVMFAENLCSPVPLATIHDAIPTVAPVFSPDALLRDAVTMFDSATAYSSGSTDAIANLAQVGRARALLSLHDFAGAAAVAATVPLTFLYSAQYSSTTSGQLNRVYERIVTNRILSVADREGDNGLPFVTGADPRVGARAIGTSRAGLPLFNFAKNTGTGTPIVLASGIEAALIRAEADLQRGDSTQWASELNALRHDAISPALPPLTADSTLTASASLRVDVLFAERAYWLYATGHRQGDLRRLIRQYQRPAESVFPTGAYPLQGLQYGSDVTFALPGEDPNPNYHGCEDRGA